MISTVYTIQYIDQLNINYLYHILAKSISRMPKKLKNNEIRTVKKRGSWHCRLILNFVF